MGNFVFGDFCEHLPDLEVQNKSNTMRTPLWPLGKEFRWFQRVVHTKLSIWRHDRCFNQFFWTVLAWSQKSKQFGAYSSFSGFFISFWVVVDSSIVYFPLFHMLRIWMPARACQSLFSLPSTTWPSTDSDTIGPRPRATPGSSLVVSAKTTYLIIMHLNPISIWRLLLSKPV